MDWRDLLPKQNEPLPWRSIRETTITAHKNNMISKQSKLFATRWSSSKNCNVKLILPCAIYNGRLVIARAARGGAATPHRMKTIKQDVEVCSVGKLGRQSKCSWTLRLLWVFPLEMKQVSQLDEKGSRGREILRICFSCYLGHSEMMMMMLTRESMFFIADVHKDQ